MARAHTSPTVLGGLLALALTPAFWPTDAAAGALCPDTEDVQLTVGQSNDAGEVEVCNGRNPDTDEDFLRVTYEATYPFCLLDTQLHVATIPEAPAEPDDNIPQNPQGRPTPGEFSYFGLPDEGCQGTATYTIPLAEIGEEVVPGDTVAIAARADLEDEDGRVEEAWGAGTRFVDRGSWAMYFTYEVQEPGCGDGSKCVFVTSGTFTADLVTEAELLTGETPETGLEGGDAICQHLADAQGSLAAPGTYLAWLSDDTGSPSTRFDTVNTLTYKRVDGVEIAAGWNDLTDGMLDAPIAVFEGGTARIGTFDVWTATTSGGLRAANLRFCGGWTSRDFFDHTVFGDSRQVTALWTETANFSCAGRLRLYCFAQ